jgi:hypothetical protein
MSSSKFNCYHCYTSLPSNECIHVKILKGCFCSSACILAYANSHLSKADYKKVYFVVNQLPSKKR